MTGQVIFDGSMLPEQTPSNNIVLTDSKVRAEFFHSHIIENMSVIRDNLFEFCCYLYRMQSEKLYHLLGFEDFKDYAVSALHLSYSLAVRYSSLASLSQARTCTCCQFDLLCLVTCIPRFQCRNQLRYS